MVTSILGTIISIIMSILIAVAILFRWIESLNTLMDDNKILTLASNERIALTPQMRLLFEISHLKCATPSSVSRAGIVHLNVQDLGWTPYITSWIESRTEGSGTDEEPGPLEDIDLPGGTLHQGERQYLTILMDKYIPSCLEVIRTRFKTILPIPEICHLQMLCRLLDCLLTPAIMTSENPRELFELYFVFACVWAFGSALPGDLNCNQRADFSTWWVSEFKAVRFPVAFGCPTVRFLYRHGIANVSSLD